MRCSICGGNGVIRIPYSRRIYCRRHFLEFIESKVERCIRRYRLIRNGDLVVVGVSGGKDSVVLAYVLDKLSSVLDFDLILLHVDLGLGVYSIESRDVVYWVSRVIRKPLYIVSLRDLLGYGLPELAIASGRPMCSVCGIVKRFILNAFALEKNASSIATGHNLTDISVYMVKEFLRQNLEGISKLYPRIDGIDGVAVTRIRPLFEVYEWELKAYADLAGLRYVRTRCPGYEPFTLDNNLKQMLTALDSKHPGLLLMMARRFVKNIEKYPNPSREVSKCSVCGLLSSSDKCSFCRLTEKALGKPMGMVVREKLRSLRPTG